jgi:predicted esterase
MATVHAQTIADLRKLFDYEKSLDPDLKIVGTKDTANATIYDILYTSVNGLKVTAYMVIPKKKQAQHPAVIFLHGEGQDKTVFLNEALHMAIESFVSLVIDAPPARPNGYRMNYLNYSEPKKDFAVYRQTAIDVRRGIDILEQNPLVDRFRISFVGFDKGSWTGALLSGVENRISCYVLMGCSPCQTCDLKNSNEPSMVKIRSSLTPEQINQYELQMRYLNPVNYLGNRFDSRVFFQFAEADPSVSEEMSDLAFKTAGEPKLEKYYTSTHKELIEFSEAKLDRKNWLIKQMK